MPKITAQGKTIECESGANLRQVLLKNQVNPHNGNAVLINCRGIGTCGTCAVAIAGKVSDPNWREKARLSLPPHEQGTTRRLACQVQVLGDIEVTKFDGFWGQGSNVQWS
ncbi:MAG: 2Fe-2S iron-sulfur cluster-binding protein [Snowella sp.]|nr:2Fe-2S iron-sulfur cluster-binding protein [Snowella sp.]